MFRKLNNLALHILIHETWCMLSYKFKSFSDLDQNLNKAVQFESFFPNIVVIGHNKIEKKAALCFLQEFLCQFSFGQPTL